MDTDTMKKLNWSQDLIDAINDIKKILDKSSIESSLLKSVDLYGNSTSSSTSINVTHYSPVGHNYIFLGKIDK